ncbi:MAG: hypothetical protein ABIT09_04710 [Croceibacterium sp.]
MNGSVTITPEHCAEADPPDGSRAGGKRVAVVASSKTLAGPEMSGNSRPYVRFELKAGVNS